MRRILSVTLIVGSLTLSSAAIQAKPVSPNHKTIPAAQDGQARQLNRLIREVGHELAMLPYYNVFDWLEGEAKGDGTVILRGQVVRPTTKSEAEARVKSVEGVERVVNEIEVLPVSPNDDRIRLAVYRALFNYNSPLFRYATQAVPPIHIIVNNGRVTLKGVVANKSDSDIANIRARGVSGVFGVTNQLQIEQQAKK
jgi:hyperosmotically inducible protein